MAFDNHQYIQITFFAETYDSLFHQLSISYTIFESSSIQHKLNPNIKIAKQNTTPSSINPIFIYICQDDNITLDISNNQPNNINKFENRIQKRMSTPQTTLIQKRVITPDDIKEIVYLLNQPPFQQNITSVGLDQLSTFQSGDLIFKIFKHLNSNIVNLNIKQTPPPQIIYQVTQFLKVLSYDCQFKPQWEHGLLNGDKKIIYPIYYFLLKNLNVLKKRAYLAKYMVLIGVPQQYSGDPQIRQLNEKCTQLQAQFQVTHEQYEAIQSSSMNPGELKKQVQKLQQQKQQLTSRINGVKAKHSTKPQLAPMLQATSLLRKQQQIQDTLVKKIQSQRSQLQTAESQLMSLQQSLVDAKKSLSPNNSPQQMVQALKNQVRKNRQIVRQRMTVEYNERLKKLQQTEKLLAQPPITQNQLMMLQNTMAGLRRMVVQMQQKLSKQGNKDDKLAIFKGQAALVTKKKQQIQQSLKKQQQDMSRLQTQIRKKQQQLNKIKGTGFKKNKLQDYINEIKQKKIKYNKSKSQIQQLKWQKNNLQKTLSILQEQKKRYQKVYDLNDGDKIQNNLQNISIQQINKQIDKLIQQSKKIKNNLAPKLQQKKNILNQFQTLQNQYKIKKISYLGTTNKIQDDIKQIQEKIDNLKTQVYGLDTKIQLNKFKIQIIELKSNRLTQQNANINGTGKGFAGAKSYQQYVANKATSSEKQIGILTTQRQKIAQQHAPSMQQKKLFGDLKKLFKCKLQAGGKSQSVNRGQKLSNNVNVLQL